jgi:hypothetical protein
MAVDALTLQTGRHVLEYLPVQAGSLMHFGGWVRI